MAVDAQVQEVLDQYSKFGVPPIPRVSPENARNLPSLNDAVFELLATQGTQRLIAVANPVPEPVGSIKHMLIPGPAGDILTRVYTPDVIGPHPILVYFHGGGWVISNLNTYDASCRALCNAAECVVVSVAYRQAPENKFPAAVEDAAAALQWVLGNADRVSGDPRRIAVGGESAGGNLATVACLMARDQGKPMPIFQLLIYPVVSYGYNFSSYEENASAKPLSSDMMPWFWKHYLRDEEDGANAYVSPLRSQNLSALPPALIITAEHDPLRDEGEAYGDRLRQEGVSVIVSRYEGMVHEFFGLSRLVSKAADAVNEAAKALKDAFAKSSPGPTELRS
jgi:acetyl esterase